MADQPLAESDSIRTIYLSEEDRDTLQAIARAQGVSASALVRTFFDEYLAGKLVPAKRKPRKTSVWMTAEAWTAVREKSTNDGLSIAEIIRAGLDRLRGKG